MDLDEITLKVITLDNFLHDEAHGKIQVHFWARSKPCLSLVLGKLDTELDLTQPQLVLLYNTIHCIISQGGFSSKRYTASVCDMKKGDFLFDDLVSYWVFPSINICFPLTKMFWGKLKEVLALCNVRINFSGCHTLMCVILNST